MKKKTTNPSLIYSRKLYFKAMVFLLSPLHFPLLQAPVRLPGKIRVPEYGNDLHEKHLVVEWHQ